MQKPIVDLSTHWHAPRPSVNYMFHLLAHHIKSVNPRRGLDAGAGELRNYWMFPNNYIGISHNRADYFRGMKTTVPHLLTVKPKPKVYLMRLESDFSFLGEFDLCVCTRTLLYVADHVDVVRRLSERVDKGGALIVENEIAHVDRYLALLNNQYEDVSVTYWAYDGCNEMCSDMPEWSDTKPPQAFIDLTNREMHAPNVREGHSRFLLFAKNKKIMAHPKSGARPEIMFDNGLFIVKADIAQLEMQD